MKLSLIVPTYNRPKDIMRLLRNLNLQIRKPDEVIIVDASETTETELVVESNMKGYAYPVSYYRHEKGLTRQRNFAIDKTQYDIIGFSDDDAIFEPDYLEKIMSIFKKDGKQEIGGASGFIYQIEGSQIPAIDHHLDEMNDSSEFSSIMESFKKDAINLNISNWRKKIEHLVLLRRKSDREGTYCPLRGKLYGICTPFKGLREAGFLSGIAFYRKKVFDRERYSEFFTNYGFGEDAYLSLKVQRFAKLVVHGEASAYHLHAPSGRPDLFLIGKMSARNRFYTFKTFSTDGPLAGLVFWFYFGIEAFLDFVPAFLGKSPLDRVNLFLGRLIGSISTIGDASLEPKSEKTLEGSKKQ
ncbi:MAG: glycosyltransferase family 2 protein [Sedimentisphaerales bacterium]